MICYFVLCSVLLCSAAVCTALLWSAVWSAVLCCALFCTDVLCVIARTCNVSSPLRLEPIIRLQMVAVTILVQTYWSVHVQCETVGVHLLTFSQRLRRKRGQVTANDSLLHQFPAVDNLDRNVLYPIQARDQLVS